MIRTIFKSAGIPGPCWLVGHHWDNTLMIGSNMLQCCTREGCEAEREVAPEHISVTRRKERILRTFWLGMFFIASLLVLLFAWAIPLMERADGIKTYKEDAHVLIGDPFSKCSWLMVKDHQGFFVDHSEYDLWVVAGNCQIRVSEGV